MAPSSDHFGSHLAERLTAHGLTVRRAAVESGIPFTTLRRKLGIRSMDFTLDELAHLAPLLGTTVGALLVDFEAAA